MEKGIQRAHTHEYINVIKLNINNNSNYIYNTYTGNNNDKIHIKCAKVQISTALAFSWAVN